jgi:hypothetical protein
VQAPRLGIRERTRTIRMDRPRGTDPKACGCSIYKTVGNRNMWVDIDLTCSLFVRSGRPRSHGVRLDPRQKHNTFLETSHSEVEIHKILWLKRGANTETVGEDNSELSGWRVRFNFQHFFNTPRERPLIHPLLCAELSIWACINFTMTVSKATSNQGAVNPTRK